MQQKRCYTAPWPKPPSLSMVPDTQRNLLDALCRLRGFFLLGRMMFVPPVFMERFGIPQKNHAPLFVFSLSPPTAVCTARSDPNSWQQNSFRGLPGTQAIPRTQKKTLKFRGPCTNRWKMRDISHTLVLRPVKNTKQSCWFLLIRNYLPKKTHHI